MKKENNIWQFDLAINICLILCFVLNFTLTLSIIFGTTLTAMLAVNILNRDDFAFETKGLDFEDFANSIAYKILMLIVTFLFTTIVTYNALSKM